MGFLDAIKGRLGGGNQSGYADDQYYDDQYDDREYDREYERDSDRDHGRGHRAEDDFEANEGHYYSRRSEGRRSNERYRNNSSGDDRFYDDRSTEHRSAEERYDEYRNSEHRYADDRLYRDDPAGEATVASKRKSSVFDGFTPLVSMSDVRSQELPRFVPVASPARPGHQTSAPGGSFSPQIRDSLPYIGNPSDSLSANREDAALPGARLATGAAGAAGATGTAGATGNLRAESKNDTNIYATSESSDPLIRRHSLNNTGDFSATSPAYYASRSGIGHVRPAGQTRRTVRQRETIIIMPTSYAEAESVAKSLKKENAVVLVLTQTRPELAKRILDFSFGAAAMAEASVESIGERVYALTSSHKLTDVEIEQLRSRGIL
jgi:cell division inhibitor SepF